MLHDIAYGTEEQLNEKMTAGYVGFDPTAPSLHIGNLAPIMLLKQLQLYGHKPIALVGGATGMIGDPSGKSQERTLLDEETLKLNQERIKKQLEKFLNFDSCENSAEIVNNYDWFKEFYFLNFLRDAGKNITVNYMIAKDSVKKRLETGISFTEFSYQLLQGYDFYYLYRTKNVRLQMGGADQWGNITTGIEYIRRKTTDKAFALTTPLVTKADGSKFGKSETGNVWLDPEKTSPYKFYQFWLNCLDEDAPRLIRIFTLLSKEEIEELERKHIEAPHLRILQKKLAEDVTRRVHSQEDLDMSIKASQILFGKSTAEDMDLLNEKNLLSVFEGLPQVDIPRSNLSQMDMPTFLSQQGTNGIIFSSKREAKYMLKSGAIAMSQTYKRRVYKGI